MSTASSIVKELKKRKFEVSLLSDEDSPCVVQEFISTGCVALDTIMGGGMPVGRMTEFYGDPSSGKSLIAAQIAAVAQEIGYLVGYADTETAVSRSMMRKLGVDINELIYASPDTVDEVFDFFDTAIDLKNKIDPDNHLVLIWDSVAATSSKAEMEKDYGEIGYMTHARVISQSLRKITRKMAKQKVAMLFLNQTRSKLGVMFGDKTATFGGKAIPFHASIRVELTLAGKLKVVEGKRKKIVGMNTRAVVVKNKVAMPFQDTLLPIYFGDGIDDTLASYNWLKANGFIEDGILHFGNKDVKFGTQAKWAGLYDKNFDKIAGMMLDTIEEDDVTDN